VERRSRLDQPQGLENRAIKDYLFLHRSVSDWVFFIALLAYAWFTLWISRDSSGYHDFLGGRFPVADGYDWVKDALNAASGYLADYGAKRPLNVPFNVFFLWLGDRISADPILGSLLIKRLIVLASIFFFLSVIRLCLSNYAAFLVGLLLISSLGAIPSPLLPQLLGQSLGYTSGTELTTMWIVTVAASILILACIKREQHHFRMFILLYSFGMFLLAIGCNMRPGTFLLLPLVVALISFFPWLMRKPGDRFSRSTKALAICLFVGVVMILLASGLEKFVFDQLSTKCGAIGGNQGYSLLGMSVGGNFRDGGRMAQAMGIPNCDRIANPLIKKIAMQMIWQNPRPISLLLLANIKAVISELSFVLPLLLLSGLMIFPSSLWTGRLRALSPLPFRLKMLSVVSISGSIGIAIFMTIFLKEASWRPATPYVLFPALAYGILLDWVLSCFSTFSPRSMAESTLIGQAGSWDHSEHSVIPALALLMATGVIASALLGLVIMHKQALGYRGYGSVSGAIERPASWLKEWQAYNHISPSMSVMYQLTTPDQPPPTLSEPNTQSNPKLSAVASGNNQPSASLQSTSAEMICVHYKRLQLPWDFPFGRLSVKMGNC
jgi:hypothetical protein